MKHKSFSQTREAGKLYPVQFIGKGKKPGTAWLKDTAANFGFYGQMAAIKRKGNRLFMDGGDLKPALDAECLRRSLFKEKKNHWGGVPPKPPRAKGKDDQPNLQCGQRASEIKGFVSEISGKAFKPVPGANRHIAKTQPDDDPKGDKAAAREQARTRRIIAEITAPTWSEKSPWPRVMPPPKAPEAPEPPPAAPQPAATKPPEIKPGPPKNPGDTLKMLEDQIDRRERLKALRIKQLKESGL